MQGKFHLSFASTDLKKAREFYQDFLKCPLGREDLTWCDFDFFGHQLTLQLITNRGMKSNYFHPKTMFPANHFGVVLEWNDWHILKDKIKAENVKFEVEPQTVFEGKIGEQSTMMILDPDGNFIEFKTFQDPTQVFAK